MSAPSTAPVPSTCRRLRVALALLACAALALRAPAADAAPATPIDVRPILEQRCWECHGERKQKGGLRLDSLAATLAGGDNGPAAVPGDVVRSPLIAAVRRHGDVHMPPKTTLPPDEVAALERWVVAGMPWPGSPPAAATPAAVAARPLPASPEAEWFEKQVRPILAERCFECHGSNEPSGGLDLTSRASVLSGGKRGPAAVSGRPEDSLLLTAVRHTAAVKMPKDGERLSEAEIAVLERWIRSGLPWAENTGISIVASSGPAFAITPAQRAFWAFQPVADPPPPAVRDRAWPRDPIDRFVLARLEAAGLAPAPAADRGTLIRRASYDLTGLPPAPEEVEAFLADRRPDAFAHVVDRLLASPRYGERWGRHWLDVVRYADAINYDPKYTHFPAYAYHYRNWVIRAFNEDLPYDRFVVQQLAGDLLGAQEGGGRDAIIATGVLALGNWQENDTEREKVRSDLVDDQIDLVGRAFLGLTLACARCHNHKFDPISSADYYALAGIFYSTRIADAKSLRLRLPLVDDAGAAVKRIEELAQAAYSPQRAAEARKGKGKAGDGPAAAKSQEQLAAEAAELRRRPLPVAYRAEDGGIPDSLHPRIGDTRIYLRGDFRKQGDVVARRFPEVLAGTAQPPIPEGRSGRLELARWIAGPEHPLTARVMANRVWQHHFAAGLVRTPGNFGKVGEAPTHPELLDHLARRLVAGGWSIKALHRAILLSATWQQSSVPAPRTLARDPDNRLLGRQNRWRLEAEAVRDSLLAVAGRLDLEVGEAPPWPRETVAWRTVFQHVSRFDPDPFYTMFDGADPSAIVAQRDASIVPQQALYLLNAPLALDCAAGVAARAGSAADDAAIERLHLLLFARRPDRDELRMARAFLARSGAGGRAAAWTAYCQALLCGNAFLFVD